MHIYWKWVIGMKKTRYLLWIFAVESVGILSGLLTRQGTKRYQLLAIKPPLTPPGIIFPVVWTILYGLMGISAARVAAAPESRARSAGLNVFVTQLIFNFFWSLIFFNAQAYGFALLWLIMMWVLILVMILHFRKVDMTAARLQIPYLFWVTFAAFLNFGVWRLNS